MTYRHRRLYRPVVVIRRRGPLLSLMLWWVAMYWLMAKVCWLTVKWTSVALWTAGRWAWSGGWPVVSAWVARSMAARARSAEAWSPAERSSVAAPESEQPVSARAQQEDETRTGEMVT